MCDPYSCPVTKTTDMGSSSTDRVPLNIQATSCRHTRLAGNCDSFSFVQILSLDMTLISAGQVHEFLGRMAKTYCSSRSPRLFHLLMQHCLPRCLLQQHYLSQYKWPVHFQLKFTRSACIKMHAKATVALTLILTPKVTEFLDAIWSVGRAYRAEENKKVHPNRTHRSHVIQKTQIRNF